MRTIITTLNSQQFSTSIRAKTGAQQVVLILPTLVFTTLNLDSDGRWSAEKFRGLMFQIEREANVIAKETRRGKGNFILCSSDVASALQWVVS